MYVRHIDIVNTSANRDIPYRAENAESATCNQAFSGRIVTAVAYLLLVILMPACSEDAKRDMIDRIVHCNSKDVQEIVLLPPESHVPLVTKPVTIKDRASIDAICQALNSASEFFPNHPSTKWEVIVEMPTQKTTVSFVVFHTQQENNGTVVSIMSHVTSGWNYGSFRSDSLGLILEQLAKGKGNTNNHR